MKKTALVVLLAFAMLPMASMAEVVVRVAPPPAVREHYGRPPHRGFVWIAGYQRWDGARYVWAPGRWERPPRPHAAWVPAHWAHCHGGWVLIEGHWR